MDRRRREQTDPRVSVIVVVPGEKERLLMGV